MAAVRMPRRYLTLMNLGGASRACRSWSWVRHPRVAGRGVGAGDGGAVRCADGHLGHAAAAPGAAGAARPRRLARLLRVGVADAGLDGPGRPVSEAIGLRTTFTVAGIIPVVVAVVAILWARLPQDELAHPLRD